MINEVILAAPDVDADNFANVAQRIEGIAKGVTLYAASNDRALIVSRNFWRNPRAGDVPAAGPLIVPGIETIDVTAASTDSFALNHSGYAENNDLLQDIGKLILSGLRPPDQRLPALKRTPSPKGDYLAVYGALRGPQPGSIAARRLPPDRGIIAVSSRQPIASIALISVVGAVLRSHARRCRRAGALAAVAKLRRS